MEPGGLRMIVSPPRAGGTKDRRVGCEQSELETTCSLTRLLLLDSVCPRWKMGGDEHLTADW